MLEYLQQLKRCCSIDRLIYYRGEFIIYISRRSLNRVLFFLKMHEMSRYDILVDICGVDYLTKDNRFEVVYNLLSMAYNSRVRLKTAVGISARLKSICSIFSNASWLEREVWDMFGIFFKQHPDLRRILTDYGFIGHPLRKDFPLSGFLEIHYNIIQKVVFYDSLYLSQDSSRVEVAIPW